MKRPVFVIVFALVCLAAPSLRAERFGAVSVENVPQAAGSEWQSSYFVREFRVENAGAARLRSASASGVRAIRRSPPSAAC